MFCRLPSFILLLLVSFSISAAVEDPETIFEKAGKYIVKIITIVGTPFVDDEKISSLGAGFLIGKSKGWILTNAHVAARSPSDIQVSFKDGTSGKGHKIYLDPVLDISIIKINPVNIPEYAVVAELGCTNDLKPGHPVGAYGHPWSLYFTAARGITSGMSYVNKDHYLQTDAAINNGNSGGPLISMKTGKVIGVNTAKVNSEEAQRLSFAIHIGRICKIIELFRAEKNPLSPSMPISFFDATESRVVKVADIFDTDISSLKTGDIILGVDGKNLAFSYPSELVEALRGKKADVSLMVFRDNKEIEVPFTIVPVDNPLDKRGIYIDGMLISENNYIDQNQVGLRDTWFTHSIESGSHAEAEKLASWDSVISFNGRIFTDVDKLFTYLKNNKEKPVTLVIKRLHYQTKTLMITWKYNYHLKNYGWSRCSNYRLERAG